MDLPRFPGCEEEATKEAKRSCADRQLMAFFYDHFQYPENDLAKVITGVVRASFTVKVDGSITDIKILQDIGAGCGMAVREALQAMPRSGIRFTPAKFWRGVKNITFQLKVTFNKGSVKIGA
ncbi:energy transducer TonB [Flavilitoribacter nigricans]|uniref:TonB C-terminal domain-containing protein n=1 Tax=Flavilitoribacter nigricans (strain ATCC 23147 / DSM 23189 / NBRC 102662 / NCIMB 1420 / SS-2) TaxID=1122177 RepID=A0A2D0NIB7_FLAN2|nr:energy transducer TonB [Flavilitoribacter nigricans]PHN08197.1 hypothetical protein CRP01_02425 [Flavilitoribacter nigricans DSM 23189 = NBRC 102662]